MSAERKITSIPERKQVPPNDTWNLTALYADDAAWQSDCDKIEQSVQESSRFKGTLGQSSAALAEMLAWLSETGKIVEKVMQYAFLKHAADGSDSENQRRRSLSHQLATRYSAATSFIEPEIMTIDPNTIESWTKLPDFKEFRVMLSKMLRFREHILGPDEEKIMALQSEVGGKAQEAFGALTNVDFDFGHVITPEGKVPLTHSTYAYLLQHSDRSVRERAFRKYYRTFEHHKNVLTNLYDASVKQDIFRAKVRSYPDSRSMFLFPDKVDPTVYDNLVSTVRGSTDQLHRYYEIRRKLLGLKKLSHYDVYVPLVKGVSVRHRYEEAVELIGEALRPLGPEYVQTLTRGLTEDRWVDRYENRGKRSGAFSSGIYSGLPYILMNYQEDVLRDVFTLAHEGGHSMHSWYSARNNPFSSYDYTIFEAEVASTFNEQLLAAHMLKHAKNTEMTAFIIGKQIDDVVATLFRQTMFAEYEMLVHRMVESGEPITVDSLRSTYRMLLEAYFGPDVQLFGVSDLEGLRIPHFYHAFYVYKYSTGLCASIALSEQVLHGTDADRDRYLAFLKSGGSKYPMDSLRLAGVDMSKPEPIRKALDSFKGLLDRFESLML
ncbi:MAG: oligoendopeptidase F [Sphaerochaetaceae bacterium]|jgi:oligoendopeptidase F|nr:oligoendopeptidase F [Sphaerochaetaceae bacterium]